MSAWNDGGRISDEPDLNSGLNSKPRLLPDRFQFRLGELVFDYTLFFCFQAFLEKLGGRRFIAIKEVLHPSVKPRLTALLAIVLL